MVTVVWSNDNYDCRHQTSLQLLIVNNNILKTIIIPHLEHEQELHNTGPVKYKLVCGVKITFGRPNTNKYNKYKVTLTCHCNTHNVYDHNEVISTIKCTIVNGKLHGIYIYKNNVSVGNTILLYGKFNRGLPKGKFVRIAYNGITGDTSSRIYSYIKGQLVDNTSFKFKIVHPISNGDITYIYRYYHLLRNYTPKTKLTVDYKQGLVQYIDSDVHETNNWIITWDPTINDEFKHYYHYDNNNQLQAIYYQNHVDVHFKQVKWFSYISKDYNNNNSNNNNNINQTNKLIGLNYYPFTDETSRWIFCDDYLIMIYYTKHGDIERICKSINNDYYVLYTLEQ